MSDEKESKRAHVASAAATSLTWSEASKSSIARTLLDRKPEEYTSQDFMQMRALLQNCSSDMRMIAALRTEPLTLPEILFVALLRNSPLPSVASASSAKSVSAVSTMSSDVDRELPFRADMLDAKQWSCECKDKSGCLDRLDSLYRRLSTFLRCVHSLASTADLYKYQPVDWQLMESELAAFIRDHVKADLTESHVPVRLVRLGLRAMWECAALDDVLHAAHAVDTFTPLPLHAEVLKARSEKVAAQILDLSKRFVARDIPDVFPRRALRLLCRFFYPSGAPQDYVVNNRERILPRPDEAVTVLQRELVRLDVDEDSMYLFIQRLKALTSMEGMRKQVKASDPLAQAFVFFEHFREETKTDFVENFCVLSEHFSSSAHRARLLSDNPVGEFKCVPVLAVFGGKVALWHRGEYIDYGKNLAAAVAGWIVIVRDVLKGQINAYKDTSVYNDFFTTRFPL